MEKSTMKRKGERRPVFIRECSAAATEKWTRVIAPGTIEGNCGVGFLVGNVRH